ncbi:MAG: polysaccharide biosynthesis C-terminal domain-containing protein, partial [Oscillospiraceae bacterium]|nr:polysaccharide biosynthesis C-terminal domain-containing protein [Oscillospiraceae bacterium]
AALSVVMTAVCALGRKGLLRLIYGAVDSQVMAASLTYFLITAFSYPFVGLFNAGAALYRSTGNSRLPMAVSLISNLINIGGNALLIFALDMGIAGAALSTLACRIFAAAVIVVKQHHPSQIVTVDKYLSIRPDIAIIKAILRIGIPAGLENCVFQIGKLAVQSTVSTLGTTAIAAQAVTYTLEYVTSMPSLAIGTGLLTVVSHCMGRGEPQEAKRYTKKLVIAGEIALIISLAAVYLLKEPVIQLSHLGVDSARLTRELVRIIFIVKAVPWTLSFVLPNCFRAAGDVKYPMVVAGLTMWLCRVALSYVLCRVLGVGLIGVWIGMMADWLIRAILYLVRYLRGTWMTKRVIV